MQHHLVPLPLRRLLPVRLALWGAPALAFSIACGAAAKPPAAPDETVIRIGAPASSAPAATQPTCDRTVPAPSDDEPYAWRGKLDLMPRIGSVKVQEVAGEVFTQIHTALLRENPSLAGMGPLIGDFFGFKLGNDFDSVAGTDAIVMVGASYTRGRAFVVSQTDLLERAFASVPRGTGTQPPVFVIEGHPRAFLQARSGQLVITPPDRAGDLMPLLQAGTLELPRMPDEGFRQVIPHPYQHRMVGIRYPKEIEELRIYARPRSDCGVDLYWEADCITKERASTAARELEEAIRGINTGVVRAFTGGLLDSPRLLIDGPNLRLRIRASYKHVVGFNEAVSALRE